MTLATTWINFEGIMLNEISQSENEKYCMISLKCGIQRSKTHFEKHTHRVVELSLPVVGDGGIGEMLVKGYKLPLGDE